MLKSDGSGFYMVMDNKRAERDWLFNSFFLGGFECSGHRTVEGYRLDLIAASQHDWQARQDYKLCRELGLRAVREAARWPVVDQQGRLDLCSVREMAEAGREAGLTLIWDLMHYGYPDDLDPFSPDFIKRFAAYARSVAEVIRQASRGVLFFTPVNEISYFAWAGGEVGYMAPFGRGRGGDLKRALVRASIAATNAIWEVDPAARILNVDPLVRLHPPPGRPDLQGEADHFNRHIVTEAFDMLAGRLEPNLGGSRAHLGLVGLNYYAGNQWTIATPRQPSRPLEWDDPAWLPLDRVLDDYRQRYGGPLVIAETGSSGIHRPAWLRHLTAQCLSALEKGIDLQGVCWYPLVSSPDWEDPTAFFDGGLVDVVPQEDGRLKRVVERETVAALREAQKLLDLANLPENDLPSPPEQAGPAEIKIARPVAGARYKVENFAYDTLLSGAGLVVEVYTFEPGASLPSHRHHITEHVLTVMAGAGLVRIGERAVELQAGETALVPSGVYYSIENRRPDRLVVQQVSAPKPWDARFNGPHPAGL